MWKFIIKRILLLIPVLFGISFILYAIMSLTPGDPAALALGESATPEAIEELRKELGLNGGFFERYFRYIWNAVRGDFGISYRTRNPVFDEVFTRFPTTCKLAFLGVGFSVIFGILLGVLSAIKQYSAIDNVTLAFTLGLTSMPDFWFGMMLIIVFAVKLGWFPISGAKTFSSFILPAMAVSCGYLASTIRMTRTSMLDVIHADYVRTAEAKGASETSIIFKHALKNALLPVITIVGVNIGAQLGGTIITEQVFGLPGLGTLLITSVRQKDIPMVMASTLFVAILASLINLATDILYAFIDPRIKSQYVKG